MTTSTSLYRQSANNAPVTERRSQGAALFRPGILTRGFTATSAVNPTSRVQTDEVSHRRRCPPPQANHLDHLLIAVGTSRDEEAFTVLFDHLRPRVQAQMVRLGLATIAAEDVTQDVMETI